MMCIDFNFDVAVYLINKPLMEFIVLLHFLTMYNSLQIVKIK